MKKALANFFFWIMGWKMKAKITDQMRHSVMVAAPHTSNWDFPMALASFWIMGLDLKYFIKNDYTKGPFGWFFKWTGAIGVDRSKTKNRLTEYAIELLKEHKMVILVPAEGTRKAVEKWRTGFYHIALEANVPISLGTLDYKKKEADIIGVFEPVGDFEKDMQFIQEQFLDITPRHPENYNKQIY